MSILIGIALGVAFLSMFGLGIILAMSKELRTTEDSIFENLDEENMYSRKVHCDSYSAGNFHW
jgi:hypothetical protein